MKNISVAPSGRSPTAPGEILLRVADEPGTKINFSDVLAQGVSGHFRLLPEKNILHARDVISSVKIFRWG